MEFLLPRLRIIPHQASSQHLLQDQRAPAQQYRHPLEVLFPSTSSLEVFTLVTVRQTILLSQLADQNLNPDQNYDGGGSLVALQTTEAVVPGSNPASLTVDNS